MARVAVTFAVNNLKKESGTKPNIWGVIEHFEDPNIADSDTGANRVVEEESKFINDTSALLVLDISSGSQLHQYEGNSTCEFGNGQVVELQKLMQETTTIQMQGSIFNDTSLNRSKLRVFAHRLQVKVGISNEVLQVTGTWHAIARFRKILSDVILDFLRSNKTTFPTEQQNHEQESIFNTAESANKGVIHLGSLSNDVLALMQKCGVYKHDRVTYDTEGGCVIIECPEDEETASRIAEEFQVQYNQLMMGGKLREYSFPIIEISNQQKIDELVKQFNNDHSQSVFKFDRENQVIKCLSMNARQLSHIKTKVKDILEKPDHGAAAAGDTATSMSMTIPGGRRITLKQANIVEEEVDVIVNPANDRLAHGAGVADAINKASQGMVQALSTNLMQQHGRPLETGQVVYTAAGGALKCKFVVHAVGPEGYKHGDKCQHLLWMACMNTLQLAEKLQAISFAIPPISTGIYKVPKDLVAKTIIQAVSSYPCHERFLQDIRIVIIDKETYDAFKPAFVDMRTNYNAGVIATQPTSPLQQNHSWPNGDKYPPAVHKEPDVCAVCKSNITDPVTAICGHKYCRSCLAGSLQASPYCAVCRNPLREITGNQPDGGKMSHQILKSSLPGHQGFNTIKITYHIPSGVQGPSHPHPGRQFSGDTRHAYLPDSPEGKEVLLLLNRAFDAKLIFTVGKSTTHNKDNTIIWNSDIHHKTCRDGGVQQYGYPDPGYLKRVKEQLRQKGIYSQLV